MSRAIPASVTRVIEEFSRLPGIGPKTASRLAYFLLRAPEEQSRALAEALSALKAQTRLCSICYNVTEEDPCPVCSDESRDKTLVCVVEDPMDVLAIERTEGFRGRYHVLHGAISPVEGIGPEHLKIRELVVRLDREPIREIIIATNPGLEGDATAMYLYRQLRDTNVRATRLARGLPVGGDLEYADSMTLARALEGRREMED